MTIDLARALSSLLVLGMVFGSACGGAKVSESTVYIDVQKIPMELRDEYSSFATNCSKCHSLSRALNAPVKDPNHWDLYVARMMRTAGSAISPKEQPVILRFLHWYTRSYDKANADPGDEAQAESESSAPAEAAPEPFPSVSAEPQAPPAQASPDSNLPPAPAGDQTPPASEEAQDVTQTTAGEGK